jgi:hypothetical protein
MQSPSWGRPSNKTKAQFILIFAILLLQILIHHSLSVSQHYLLINWFGWSDPLIGIEVILLEWQGFVLG